MERLKSLIQFTNLGFLIILCLNMLTAEKKDFNGQFQYSSIEKKIRIVKSFILSTLTLQMINNNFT